MRLGKRLARFWRATRTKSPASTADTQQPPSSPVVNTTRYFYLGPDVALTRLLDGHHLFVDPQDESVSMHLIAHGFWETWIHDAVQSLIRPGNRVVEVGANLGVYTISMARGVGETGHVVSLEANPRLATLVQRSIDFNGYKNRVSLLQKAATNEPGSIKFRVARLNSGGGHASVDFADFSTWNDRYRR